MGIRELFTRDTKVVWLEVDGVQRARHIEVETSHDAQLDPARAMVKIHRPADAKLIRTYTGRDGLIVEVFHSESLAAAIPGDEAWDGEDPGTFIQVAGREGERTTRRVVLAMGNRP